MITENKFTKVYTSEIARQTADPIYNPSKMSFTQFANSNSSLPIKIVIRSQFKEYATCNLSCDELMEKKTFAMMPKGSLNVRKFEMIDRPGFVDYLRSGWGISLACAIDYTASNGAPSTP